MLPEPDDVARRVTEGGDAQVALGVGLAGDLSAEGSHLAEGLVHVVHVYVNEHAALADNERDRPVSEDDLDDHAQPLHADPLGADTSPGTVGAQTSRTVDDVVEPDLREIAAAEPRQTREDETRVPDADEIATSVGRARRTVREITAREAYDRAVQAGQWASIAEEERPDVFTMRVGNILPGERVVVELRLVGRLPLRRLSRHNG